MENFESLKKLESVNPVILSKLTLDSNNNILIDSKQIVTSDSGDSTTLIYTDFVI